MHTPQRLFKQHITAKSGITLRSRTCLRVRARICLWRACNECHIIQGHVNKQAHTKFTSVQHTSKASKIYFYQLGSVQQCVGCQSWLNECFANLKIKTSVTLVKARKQASSYEVHQWSTTQIKSKIYSYQLGSSQHCAGCQCQQWLKCLPNLKIKTLVTHAHPSCKFRGANWTHHDLARLAPMIALQG